MQHCHIGSAMAMQELHPSEHCLTLPGTVAGTCTKPSQTKSWKSWQFPRPLQGFVRSDPACHPQLPPSLRAVTATHGDTLPAAHCLSLCCNSRALIVSKLPAHTRRCPCEEVPGERWGGGQRRGPGLPPPPSSHRIQQPAGKQGSAGKGQRAQPWEGERWREAEPLPPVPAAPGVLGKGSPHLPPGHAGAAGAPRAVPSSPMAPGDTGDPLQPLPCPPPILPTPSPTRTFLSLLFLYLTLKFLLLIPHLFHYGSHFLFLKLSGMEIFYF